ncbi:MAG: UDP-2,3-diacylglucosamine diphosphatase [Phycisphaerae bacterium]|nr:UDP-2,3-diacylglucosamine diphosphatase [Phycisphaerae bacterium]
MDRERDIFVISDLHIGDGGPRDNFAQGKDRQRELDGFLDYVEKENGELILLGDLFEFWQASLSKVIVGHLRLMERLEHMGAVYALGNHDVDLKEFMGTGLVQWPLLGRMTGPFERRIGGRNFRFMHGHEVDPYNCGDKPGWGRLLAIFAGIYEDRVGSPMMPSGEAVENALEEFGQRVVGLWNWLVKWFRVVSFRGSSPDPKKELPPSQNPARIEEMVELYWKDKCRRNYDVAIVGHTHQPGRIGSWYYNSGCWVQQDNTLVRIRPDGTAGVFSWKQGQPEPNETVLPGPGGDTA